MTAKWTLPSALVSICCLVGGAPETHGQAGSQNEPPGHHYTVEPTPDWVQPVAGPEGPSKPSGSGSAGQSGDGVEYLLFDRQVRVDQSSSQYSRMVTRLVNPSGVEHQSQITIGFDPEKDRLIIHSITLRRGTQSFDELSVGRVEVLQREAALEKGVLDGSLTFHLVMSDVRVGDTLDYSFTIEHREADWGNRFFSDLSTRWEDPVARAHLRILTRPQAPLYVLDQTGQKLVKSHSGEWEIHEWSWSDVPSYVVEADTPSWFEQSRVIQLSQFRSWGDVVNMALPLFTATQAATAQLADLIAKMKSAGDSDMTRALAVLRFVQEEIRYTGIELGAGAYRPTSPAELLQRRYGDCKDKALLLVTLLRGLGIDAAPALVSTRWRAHARDRLPSPGVFNHAIVRARIHGKTFWLDGTEVAQGGDLQRYTEGFYGAALVIEPGVKELELVPRESAPEPLVTTTANYDFRNGLRHDSRLTVSTRYIGRAADSIRESLRSTTTQELSNRYANYYKKQYAGIKATAPLVVRDDPRSNELTVEEAYQIENAFEPGDDGKSNFTVQAEIISDHLRAPDTPVRTTPMGLDAPINVAERVELSFSKLDPPRDETRNISGPGFEYHALQRHDGNTIVLDYHYQTFADEVPVDQLAQFLKKREEARLDTYFEVTTTGDADSRNAALDSKAAKLLQNALQSIKDGHSEKAEPILSRFIESSDFATTPAAQQRAALILVGAIAIDRRDGARALTFFKRASDVEGADGDVWTFRLEAAQLARDHAEAATAVTTLAQRWPKALASVDSRSIAQAVRQAPDAGPTRYKLLKALFDAKYTTEGFPPSGWWRDLALLQLERGEPAEAKETLARVTDPYVAVSILADKRFEPVRASTQGQWDVSEMARQQIDAAREIVRQQPDKLQPMIELTYFLIYSERFDEALKLCDEIIARVNGGSGAKVFSDYAGKYVWVLDNRSRALEGLGRFDEALAQEVAASHLPELGDDNVSQIINLAGFYNERARPKEAREVLAALDPAKTSGYGRTQVAAELLSSAEQLGDAAEMNRQLQYLRDHRDDSLKTLEHALVRAGREDEAAQLLISRLENLSERVPALMDVQQYQDVPLPPKADEFYKLWRKMLGRSDVQAAIAKVGAAGKYPLLDPIL